jgi:predicted nucleic acid-binding protein
MLVDTSVWIDVLRDKTGYRTRIFRAALGAAIPILPRFAQLELLQGARDEAEWELLASYLETQHYADPCAETWAAAARTYFDLRRLGITIRSPIDCCIAQLALETGLPLLHRDEDFQRISTVRPLKERYLEFDV